MSRKSSFDQPNPDYDAHQKPMPRDDPMPQGPYQRPPSRGPHYEPPYNQPMPQGGPYHEPPYNHPMPHGPPMIQPPQPQIMHQQQSSTNVVVVNQQPTQENRLLIGSVHGHRDWTTGLFGCSEDFGGCMKAAFCPSCVIMEISAKLNENVCVTNLVPGSMITLRTRLRTLGGIEGSIFKDYCALSCCWTCAICQMDREMKAMGL